MKKIKAFWDLFRLEHGIMYGVGVIIGVFVSNPNYTNLENLAFGFFTALFLQASAFALNDYFDYEVDLANRRFDRPLVRGELSKKEAILSFFILMPIGFFFAYLISSIALLLALAITLIGYIYDIKLKEFGVAGNVYIAFSMAAPFVFGSIVAENYLTIQAAILALIAFLSGVGREIMKGIEDVEGDAIRDVKTVARIKGVRTASICAALLFITSIFLSFVPFFLIKEYYLDFKYMIPVLVTDAILTEVSFDLLNKDEKIIRQKIGDFRKKSLTAMGLGLMGFLAGAF
ncbi:prenyltransferase [Archaeoglobales archaeon]|nr:MAG: prenyltransferase [Archaeoglobales archaeon]